MAGKHVPQRSRGHLAMPPQRNVRSHPDCVNDTTGAMGGHHRHNVPEPSRVLKRGFRRGGAGGVSGGHQRDEVSDHTADPIHLQGGTPQPLHRNGDIDLTIINRTAHAPGHAPAHVAMTLVKAAHDIVAGGHQFSLGTTGPSGIQRPPVVPVNEQHPHGFPLGVRSRSHTCCMAPPQWTLDARLDAVVPMVMPPPGEGQGRLPVTGGTKVPRPDCLDHPSRMGRHRGRQCWGTHRR